jgi:hypothetical protein
MPSARTQSHSIARVNFADEVDAGNDALDELQAVSGSASLHFCGGNHEWRFDRYLMSRAPELGGLAGMKTQALLKLRERGMQWIPYQRHIKIGNCAFTHDLGRAGDQRCTSVADRLRR